MKEELYTIPVIDGFQEDCECPICAMHKTLEQNAIDYTMGSSYMEDDVRAETDRMGFCNAHLTLMYQDQNRLGLALILSTHMDYTIKQMEQLQKQKPTISSLFKKSDSNALSTYLDKQEHSCFICSRIEHTLKRYFSTIFYLYKKEPDFQATFENCNGFCTKHYGMLYHMAPTYLKGEQLDAFLTKLHKSYFDNMKRVREDLEWFKDKFDYRYADEPWKNSQDALPRTMIKLNSLFS